jgi:spore coat protein A, manganese oxidase
MKMDVKLSRRQFLKGVAIAGAGMALPLKFGVRDSYAFYQSQGLSKWNTTLRGVGPGGIPVAAWDGYPNVTPAPVTGVKHYKINIEQFKDDLHPDFGPNTTLWGFNPVNPLGGGVQPPKHLGGIIVAERGVPVQITFYNKLTSNGTPTGTPLKSIIPVDATIPGANQAQNRTAVHIHGGLVPWISDGGPFDWWAPNGTHGLSFLNNQVLNPTAPKNAAEYYYPNNQSARFVWYHDHAFGITRTNAYAGIATAYIIRDNFERAMQPKGLPEFIESSVLGGHPIRELPIVIQDKIFVGSNINALDPTWVSQGLPSAPGSLWYPHVYEKNRWKLIGAGSRLPNPSIIAEMFGDTMLVNGTVHPKVTVEARRYRLRILNACNARFLNLQLYVGNGGPEGITFNPDGTVGNTAGPDWLVLGTEAGFLQKPVLVQSDEEFSLDATTQVASGSLITGNAERWDVLVDFTGFANSQVILYNDAPAPFPGGDPRNDFINAAGTSPDTRQIMRFDVVPTTGTADAALTLVDKTTGNWTVDPGIDPPLANVNPNGTYTLNVPKAPIRRLTLNETFDAYGRLAQLIGTDVAVTPGKFGRAYLDTPTEIVNNGDVEIWEILNLTADTHPIHFHLVNVQVLNREAFNALTYTGGAPALTPNTLRGPEPTELGWKETVKMHPGEVTRVIMQFVVPPIKKANGQIVPTPPSPRTGFNEYVYHCHILEHEEHDMMRPLVVK